MNKKEWQVPVLEVLDVDQTMLQVKAPTSTDATFQTNTPFPQLTWS
jgi:hypothetical protein